MLGRIAPLVTLARAPIAQLLHDLRALGDLRRRSATVDERLEGFHAPVDRLVRHLALPRRGYARTLVFRDDAFELLLLAWAPGSRAPIHDHASQDCWFVPLAGTFDVDDYALAAVDRRNAWLVPVRSRRVGPGDLDRRDEREPLHAVTPATPLALSLHVYARPIDRCRIFHRARGTWSWRQLAYDHLAPQLGE
jgi:cysteine dioxygenase type I